ncbi:LptF/LptG family permease [Echinicola marina]|uniref:LptF/LptG family permease n=1 Tax=Echinicola marina TaxID=2859768 RepID=UPI001CF67EB9|nr:LptF/LptG family permease [Echinicola marina]UCS92665.1 LptF/LptG family permease [Echinicola marina]
MKKLDKLILGSFIGPFLLTFIVVDFILLTVNMLKYFDEIFGKGLGFGVYMELIAYFVVSISPMALPLAVLLSSLMTFGNLGEHFELTAIKSSGISLVRALMPIGVFVFFLTIAAFFSNNYLVPKVNLKTFSLLYDIRMKSPALDIKEGVFYNGIPNYSIKVNKKLDDIRLQDVIIYDHSSGQGNLSVIMADSGRMEPYFNDRYMKLTLFQGNSYNEDKSQRGIRGKPVPFTRTKFDKNEIVFSLDAFEMDRTPENLWSSNRSIKNIREIKMDVDSMSNQLVNYQYYNYAQLKSAYSFFSKQRDIQIPEDLKRKKAKIDSLKDIEFKRKMAREEELAGMNNVTRYVEEEENNEAVKDIESQAKIDSGKNVTIASNEIEKPISVTKDSLSKGSVNGLANTTNTNKLTEQQEAEADTVAFNRARKLMADKKKDEEDAKTAYLNFSERQVAKIDSVLENGHYKSRAATMSLQSARTIRNNFSSNMANVDGLAREKRRFEIAWYQKYTQAFACMVMFMIGAPLGAIIKKGGLGMPVLLSIIFFILFYMLNLTGEKWAKEGMADPLFGSWFANIALIPAGIFFLRQARKDARLFEADAYYAAFQKIKERFKLNRRKKL